MTTQLTAAQAAISMTGLTRRITTHLTTELSRAAEAELEADRKSTRLNSSHVSESRMPSSA